MSDSTDQDIRVRGTVQAVDGRGVVRIEMMVASPVAEVWTTATDPTRLAEWLGEVSGDLRVGGAFHGLFFPSGWDGDGRVLECEPGHRFLVESAEAGNPLTTDELAFTSEGDDRTRIVLTKRGTSLEWIAAFAVGLQLHVENLVASLDGRPPVDPDPFWADLMPQYEALAAEL